MLISLSLDDRLIKEVRKIAVERHTTLTSLVRTYLEQLAHEHGTGSNRREQEALENTFQQFKVRVGKKTSRREDLYARS
jgi:Family of unknown function (DUF6364)